MHQNRPAYLFVNPTSIVILRTFLMLVVVFLVVEDSTISSVLPREAYLSILAKRTMRNLIIKASPTNQEYKITSFSERPCKDQTFTLRQRGQDDDAEPTEVTVCDYFVSHHNIDLRYSGNLPCINVGRPQRPTYILLELCSLLSLQRYTKALSTSQRSSFVERLRQKPQERMIALSNALKINNYDVEPLLKSCGVSINKNFTAVEGRGLPAPKLKLGGEDLFPRNGGWNLKHKGLIDPAKVEKWDVVNISACCNMDSLIRDFIRCGDTKGIAIEPPTDVFEESPQFRRALPRVVCLTYGCFVFPFIFLDTVYKSLTNRL